jgi:hypothetical protein
MWFAPARLRSQTYPVASTVMRRGAIVAEFSMKLA